LPRKNTPNLTDQHVGARVRMRRKMVAMSQEKLGAALGLTFQQVQKYEKGATRISASRLHQMSHILQVPVEFFFKGAPNASAPHGSNRSSSRRPRSSASESAADMADAAGRSVSTGISGGAGEGRRFSQALF
jgi:transcriptional regulator with XRE-family HTH domain